MGTERVEIKIIGSISKHNSAQDDIDEGVWLELRGRIRKLLEEDRYQSISAEVW